MVSLRGRPVEAEKSLQNDNDRQQTQAVLFVCFGTHKLKSDPNWDWLEWKIIQRGRWLFIYRENCHMRENNFFQKYSAYSTNTVLGRYVGTSPSLCIISGFVCPFSLFFPPFLIYPVVLAIINFQGKKDYCVPYYRLQMKY